MRAPVWMKASTGMPGSRVWSPSLAISPSFQLDFGAVDTAPWCADRSAHRRTPWSHGPEAAAWCGPKRPGKTSRTGWPTWTSSTWIGGTCTMITSGRSCGMMYKTGSAGRMTERGVVTCRPSTMPDTGARISSRSIRSISDAAAFGQFQRPAAHVAQLGVGLFAPRGGKAQDLAARSRSTRPSACALVALKFAHLAHQAGASFALQAPERGWIGPGPCPTGFADRSDLLLDQSKSAVGTGGSLRVDAFDLRAIWLCALVQLLRSGGRGFRAGRRTGCAGRRSVRHIGAGLGQFGQLAGESPARPCRRVRPPAGRGGP